MGNLFYNAPKYRDGFGITRAVLFYFHRIALVKEQFVILSKTGSLYQQPNLFRFFLTTSSVLEYELKTHISDVLIDAYNKKEVQIAKTEHRNAELLPKVSAHIMRHTACTRMAEKRIDVKVLQYIMGHAHIDVTMEVYNHVSEMSRIESEITRLENVAIS